MNADSFVTVRDIGDVYRSLTPHLMPFAAARYLLLRALELKAVEGFRFARPMLEIGIGDGKIATDFFAARVDYGADVRSYDPCFYDIYGQVLRLNESTNLLPLPDASLGSIYSLSVLEHVRNLELLLAESHRVLRPGGQFVANVPTEGTRLPPFCLPVDSAPHVFDPPGWRALLEKAGLKVVNIVSSVPPWVPLCLEILSTSGLAEVRAEDLPAWERFWLALYQEGAARTDPAHDLTVTVFCER